MPTLHTEIEIEASKQRVWRVLFEKERWIHWNPFLFDRDPMVPLKPGQEVMLSLLRNSGEGETEFKCLVIAVRPEVYLKWIAEIPGFKTETSFELQEIGPGRTKYIHRQTFSGWLVRVFLPFIREDDKRGMERMARELKRYIEQPHSLGYRY